MATMIMTPAATVPGVEVLTDALSARTKAIWTAGDFGKIATSYEQGAAEFVSRLGLKFRDRVLDVASGTGNLTIPAARTGAFVTGLDIAPNLLQQADSWATAEGLTVRLDEGNAEALPYPTAHFDVVMSMFGAMFAPRAADVAAELLRVTRPGGMIAMANWTPDGFIGQMFKIVGKHVPPPAGVPSPLLWGNGITVAERFGDAVVELRCIPRTIEFFFPVSPAETVDTFRTYYGPTVRAFDALDAQGQNALRQELTEQWAKHNRASDGTTQVRSTYLEVIGVRK